MSTEKFSPFREYRESGVEWVGLIPTEWDMWKLSHAFDEIGSGTTPPSDSSKWYGGDILWITTGELREREIIETRKTVTTSALKKFSTLRVYPKGSIAIAMYGATIGRIGVLGVEATTNQACCVLPSSKVMSNTYLYYWFQAFRNDIVNLASGGGQPNISQAVVSALGVSAPELLEQTQIAKFLDYETAKIDALIEKQQQLIALLKEKRQAVISHAVTKGLNPDAPMRDSGVEWLGEVPAHWVVPRIGYVARVFNGSTPSRDVSQYWIEEGVPWISSGKVNEDIVQEPTSWISKRALAECSIELAPKGSVIVGMIGQGKTRATCAMLGIETTINQNMAALVSGRDLDSRYLYRVMTAAYNDLRLLGRGANQPALNCDILRAYRIPLPPLEEQTAIARHAQEMFNRTGRTMELAARQRDLLQERRTALISAAVTGKIDVRGWKHPESKSKLEGA